MLEYKLQNQIYEFQTFIIMVDKFTKELQDKLNDNCL